MARTKDGAGGGPAEEQAWTQGRGIRLLGIGEALTWSEYVTTILNQSVDVKGFEYPADLAVFIETQRKLCTRGKFQ